MLICAAALTFAHAAPTVGLLLSMLLSVMLFALRAGAGAEKGYGDARSPVAHQLQPALYTPSTLCHDTPAASKLVALTSSTTCIPSTVAFALPIAFLNIIFCPSPGPFSGLDG
eukprot:1014162-Pelagomonas_calceolata.AAC.1